MRAKRVVTVYCLISDEEMTFTDITPIDALISATLMYEQPNKVSDPLTRSKQAKRIIFGRTTASIGDYGVTL